MIKQEKVETLLGVLMFFLISLTGCYQQGNKPLKLKDNFEAAQIADFWARGNYGTGRYVPGAISISNEYARAGKSSVKINLQKGFIRQDGGDGHFTERTELDSRKHPFLNDVVLIRYSVFIPEEFSIIDNRLVISQLKQSGASARQIFAQRFRNSRHYLTIWDLTDDSEDQMKFDLPDLTKGQWHDIVFKIYISIEPEGFIKMWMNGEQVVDFTGETAHRNGFNRFYHKFGLYRDEWDEPMNIYFDEYLISNDTLSFP